MNTEPERWTPHATVATIVEQDGQYLMVEENRIINAQGDLGIVYNQPAGHIDAGETITAAAIRETFEETRWQVTLTHLVGIYVFTAPANGVTYHRYCFAAKPIKQIAESKLDDGILNATWLNWEEISQLDNLRSPLVKKCIQDHIQGKRYPLELIYEHIDS